MTHYMQLLHPFTTFKSDFNLTNLQDSISTLKSKTHFYVNQTVVLLRIRCQTVLSLPLLEEMGTNVEALVMKCVGTYKL